jgi:hypothetical protein
VPRGLSKHAIGNDARLTGGDIAAFVDEKVTAGAGSLVAVTVGLALSIWIARTLYRRGIFLRV